MAGRKCEVRVDDVDGRIYFETPDTEAASVHLHALLELGRETPRPWMPFVVLSGENGSGRTALAGRFMAQAQRAITCTLVDRARETRDTPRRLPSAEALQRRQEEKVADEALRQRVREFGGHCPRICAPAAFAPEAELDRAIHAAMHGDGHREKREDAVYRHAVEAAKGVVPAQMLAITHKPEANWLDRYITGTLVRSHGDRSRDPLRRTQLLFVDGADRLLAVSDRDRRTILQNIKDVPRAVTVVLIGSPELAAAVQAEGVTQTIAVPNLDGEVFAEVVRLVFGECNPAETRRLQAATNGAIGPLLHIAGLRGLKPPYAVPRRQVLRLPAPA